MNPTPPRPLSDRPSWVRDAVVYQVFPDRFARSGTVPAPGPLEPWDAAPTPHGYKGGDLRGVLEHLVWIQDLGADTIWLNPIFASSSNHRYHTHDYERIDGLLGGREAFDSLLEACHERGIRLILDGVFNHVGRGFQPFNDLLENGETSPWAPWFHIKRWPLGAYDLKTPPGYEAWWNLHALPKLNTDYAPVRDYLMSVVETWTKSGIDGWRLDVPNEIKTPGFWEEFRRRVRSVNPDAWIVGEIWERADEWISDASRFDGTMNYPLAGAILAFCAGDRIDPELVDEIPYPCVPPLDGRGFAESLQTLFDAYPREAYEASLNLLGSHDTPRLMTVVGGSQSAAKLSTLLLFTLPGAPMIYYGDEIGLRGGADPECRKGFPWSRPEIWNQDLLAHHREIAKLRRAHPALRRGDYENLTRNGDWPKGLHAFLRSDDDEKLLVAINTERDEVRVKLERDAIASGCLFGEGRLAAGELHLPARSGVVLALDPSETTTS